MATGAAVLQTRTGAWVLVCPRGYGRCGGLQHKEMMAKKEAEEAEARKQSAGDSSDGSSGKRDDAEATERKEEMRKQLREVGSWVLG